MPTLSGFQISILAMDATPPARLPELDVRRRGEATMTQRPGPVGSSLAGTCECFIASSPGQQFRVQVGNTSATNACASLYVDGEWIYSGLSYGPKHRLIYFSGKLLDESTVQQMHFVDTDTTCTFYCRVWLTVDDSNDGRHAKEGLGTIVVKIHRVNVLGKWEGKLSTSPPMEVKPILLGEKSGDPELEHRVGYIPFTAHVDQKVLLADQNEGPRHPTKDRMDRPQKRSAVCRIHLPLSQSRYAVLVVVLTSRKIGGDGTSS
jgi:hypothetical protein